MYLNFELTEFNIHLGLLENSAMVSVGTTDEYLKKCQSYYRLILKLLQRKKELMLNVIPDVITVQSAHSVAHRYAPSHSNLSLL